MANKNPTPYNTEDAEDIYNRGFRAGLEAAAQRCDDGSANPDDWGAYYAENIRAMMKWPNKTRRAATTAPRSKMPAR